MLDKLVLHQTIYYKSIKNDLIKELSYRIEVTYGKDLSANTNTQKLLMQKTLIDLLI